MVGMLCLLAAISYLDRYIVALLAAPLMTDLDLSPTRLGLLMGVGFGLLYAIASVPFAHAIDRRHRVQIVAAGVTLWSAATVASAFAPTFELLAVTRAGVAIGEAVLVPAAVSLVGDLFPPARRALPIGAFMAVSTLMGTGSFLVGGWILAWAEHAVLPLAPWRTTFLTIGLAGLAAVPLWLAAAREPARTAAGDGFAEASFAETLRYAGARWRLYLPLYLAFAVSAVASYGFLSWVVAMLGESHALTAAEAGRRFGTIGLVAGGAAAVFWPWLGGRAISRAKPQAAIALIAAGLLVGHGAVAATLTVAELTPTLALIGVAVFGHGAAAGLAVLAIQTLAPGPMRARLVAFYMLSGNFAGLIAGPVLPGWLIEHAIAGPDALRLALAATAGIAGPVAAVLLVAASRSTRGLN